MAVLSLDMYSYELAMNTQLTMILPERRGVPHAAREGKPYPVLYLLHGHGLDHTGFLRLSRIEQYLQNSDVIVVMPNGSRGCFVDGVVGHRYGTYLTEELPQALSNWFHISPAREDCFIAGTSMGGYGALHAAYSHPERYAAVAAMSAAIHMRDLADTLPPDARDRGIAFPPIPEISRNLHRIYGSPEEYAAGDLELRNLARKLRDSGITPPRTLSICGDRDPLIHMNDEFAAFMAAECPSLPFTYQVSDGIHNFDYWDRELPGVLRFFGLL